MGSTYTSYYSLEKPNPGQERGVWGQALNENFDAIDKALNISEHKVLSWQLPELETAGDHWILGFDVELIAAAPLDDITPVDVTVGNSRLRIDVNAGTDMVGALTITGDSRHSATGTISVAATEVVPISGAGTYISGKYWTGDVTLSTANLDITSLDVHQISWYDNNGRRFATFAANLQGFTTAIGAGATVSLQKAVRAGAVLTLTEVTGGLLDIASASADDLYWDMGLEFPTIDVSGGDEGIICKVTTTGAAGEVKDLRLDLHYENRINE